MNRLPKAYREMRAGRARLRFYLADALDIFHALEPHTLYVIVTSPPYNLGIVSASGARWTAEL